MIDVQQLKARVDLQVLVQETHQLTKGSKLHCLWHDDANPSLHVYPDGYYCFACGASGDHLDWLTATRALSFQEALAALEHGAGTFATSLPRLTGTPSPITAGRFDKPSFEWYLPLRPHQLETHRRRAARLREVPEALIGRGLTLADCRQLGIVNENGNAIFPVVGPEGLFLTLKCRYAVPNPHRYEYVTPGRGTPAWCSPDIRKARTILVIEGELNGMVCWLALCDRQNLVGVMGTAGVYGSPHFEELKNKTVYLYADDDEAGHEARQRWAKQTIGSGAKEVYLREPWPLDACDIAGMFGKSGLRKRLAWSKKNHFETAQSFDAGEAANAVILASNKAPFLSANTDLMQWCSHSEAGPFLTVKPLALASFPVLAPQSRHDAS